MRCRNIRLLSKTVRLVVLIFFNGYSTMLTSSRTKAKLLNKKLKNPNDANIQSYKIFIKIYNRIRRTLKINYYKQMLDENKYNSKKTWSILKQAIGKSNDKSSFPQSFKIDNINITDRSKIAESFNNFFGKNREVNQQ